MQQPQEKSQSTQGSEADSSVDLEAATPPVASLEIPTKTTQEKAELQSSASASNGKVDEKSFDHFTPRRKAMITLVVSVGAFMPPMGSTMLLSAIPQIATHFETSATLINYCNALYMLAAGMSPFIVATLSSVYGRKKILLFAAIMFTAFSIGTAFAPNLAAFFVFRILTAFHSTTFLIVGSNCLGDIYRPTERATAVGWFMLGFELGPTLGPFFGGLIVTYQSWRCIFYLQTALGGLSALLILFLLPETVHYAKSASMLGLSFGAYVRRLAYFTNPMRVLRLYLYPNILCAGIASSALLWNMYSLLTPITQVLNPRFGLTSPLQSALFYLAPGAGYLVGTFLGGRWADRTVKHHMKKRNGERVPEDRLKSCLPAFGIILPASILLYGWSIQEAFGGIPLPTIMLFAQGVAQLFAFPSVNTYCLDVMQDKGWSAEVVAGNYLIRYVFAAAGSAVCLPAVDAMGVGWFSTISSVVLIFSAGLVWATSIWGREWREAVDRRYTWSD